MCMYNVISTKETKQTHQENHKCDKKCMDVHHLNIDQTQRLQFLAPFEILREYNMDSSQHYQDYSNYFKMQFHFLKAQSL